MYVIDEWVLVVVMACSTTSNTVASLRFHVIRKMYPGYTRSTMFGWYSDYITFVEELQMLCDGWDAGEMHMAFPRCSYPFALEIFVGWQQNRLREMVCALEQNDNERSLFDRSGWTTAAHSSVAAREKRATHKSVSVRTLPAEVTRQ